MVNWPPVLLAFFVSLVNLWSIDQRLNMRAYCGFVSFQNLNWIFLLGLVKPVVESVRQEAK